MGDQKRIRDLENALAACHSHASGKGESMATCQQHSGLEERINGMERGQETIRDTVNKIRDTQVADGRKQSWILGVGAALVVVAQIVIKLIPCAVLVAVLAGCACTQEQSALADLRAAGAEPAAIEAAESAVGDCEERALQVVAIVAKVVAAALP